ncbi:MAG TPA: lysylphosphatidylglycerol synthase transmembrane domain-containing protein [Geminicoccaceae bacterium]|nr:lysylphosphatidylglycerol synthase transmembrane domain-containing protein [Geminicoccaceae bacterium]
MSTTRRRVLSTLLGVAVTAIVARWLLSDEVVAAFVASLDDARPWHLAAALALVPVIQYLRAWRFALLQTGAFAPPDWRMCDVTARLMLFNFVLPFKLGELSFPVMLRRAFGTPFVQGAGILILARLLDAAVVGAVLLLSAAALLDPATLGWSRPALVAAGLAALAAPLLGTALLAAWRPAVRPPRLAVLLDSLLLGFDMLRATPQRLLALALSCGVWGTHFVVGWLAASAVADGLRPLAVVMAGAASYLAFALPVPTVAGLGPPQAAWAWALSLTGVPWGPAVVTGLVCYGVLIVGAVALGLLSFVLRPAAALLAAGRRRRARGAAAPS